MTDAEFTAAYRDHFTAVYRFLLFRASDRQDAEDLTAETFTRLLANRSRLGRDDVLPWLYAVAKNLAINESKRRRRTEVPLEDAPPLTTGSQPWRDPAVWQAVRRLRRDEQLVVFLKVVEDLRFTDVARIVGRSESAVKMSFYRGLRKLANTLEEGETRVRSIPAE